MKIFQRGHSKRNIGAAGPAGLVGGLVLGLVVACGGGGGANYAGIDRLGVSTGTITGFGSIFVNGVEYETGNGTMYLVDDVEGAETDLGKGQVVTIRWTSNDNGATFRADDVIYNKTLEGPVTSIDVNAQSFVVLGQTVFIDDVGTTFDSSDSDPNPLVNFAGLRIGDNVEVSGLIGADGIIRATRVDRQEAGDQLEIRGVVAGLTTTTFTINEQVVDYASASPLGFTLADGDFVEVKGDSINGSGQLVATEVKLEEGLPSGGDGDEGELEGFVTDFDPNSPGTFSVNGSPVITDAATEVTGGVVALNARVEVKGIFNAVGELLADTIEIKD